jgi:hypothetical protein
MAGGGDGQEFGEAFDDAQERRGDERGLFQGDAAKRRPG